MLSRLGRSDEARKEQGTLDRLKADLDQMNDIRVRLSKSPDDASLQSRLALWMFSHGFEQEGLKWAGKILNDHPGHRETCFLLAEYHEKQGNHELALYYRTQMSTTPTRSSNRVERRGGPTNE